MTAHPETSALAPAQENAYTPRRRAWTMFRHHTPAITSLLLLALKTLLVALAPFIAPYEFDDVDFKNTKSPPTWQHLMGTDDLGRDQFTRLLYGGRISHS